MDYFLLKIIEINRISSYVLRIYFSKARKWLDQLFIFDKIIGISLFFGNLIFNFTFINILLLQQISPFLKILNSYFSFIFFQIKETCNCANCSCNCAYSFCKTLFHISHHLIFSRLFTTFIFLYIFFCFLTYSLFNIFEVLMLIINFQIIEMFPHLGLSWLIWDEFFKETFKLFWILFLSFWLYSKPFNWPCFTLFLQQEEGFFIKQIKLSTFSITNIAITSILEQLSWTLLSFFHFPRINWTIMDNKHHELLIFKFIDSSDIYFKHLLIFYILCFVPKELFRVVSWLHVINKLYSS